MPKKHKLLLNISKSPSTPLGTTPSSQTDMNHTNYVDLVRNLRNPVTAGPINTWMTTGRLMDHYTRQNGRRSQRPTPQRQDPQVDAETYDCFFDEDTSDSLEATTKACKDFSDEDMDSISEVTAEAYKDVFGQNMSGSLSGSMISYMSAVKVQELPEIIVFAEPLEIHGFSPYQKPYAYPPEIYTEDHSDDEYLSLFASFQDVAES